MNAKECRNVFNTMVKGLAARTEDPTTADPGQILITIEMHKLQAMWEICAQLAEANEAAGGGGKRIQAIQ